MYDKKFQNCFYFFTCILPDYVAHEIIKEFGKNSHFENMTAGSLLKLTSVFHPWNDTFSDMEKIDFHRYCPLIVIVLAKCSLYCIWMIFWSFLGTMTYTKDNFFLHESIFQWQIKLISHQSEFWHLRRKPAVIFSKWLFFQNSLGMSWAI